MIVSIALSLTDLLKNDLFGGLGRYSAQDIGGLVDFDVLTGFCRRIDTLRIPQGNLRFRVGYLFDDLSDAEDLDLAAISIEPRMKIFLGPVVFLCGSKNGILHRPDDDVGIDTFLPAYLFNGSVE